MAQTLLVVWYAGLDLKKQASEAIVNLQCLILRWENHEVIQTLAHPSHGLELRPPEVCHC